MDDRGMQWNAQLGSHAQWVAEYNRHDADYQESDDMGRYASNAGGDYAQPPADNHIARCYRIIDLGTQEGEYQGKKVVRNQVMISWELPDCLIEDGESAGKPFTVSKFFTNSLNDKATLRANLITWRGRDFTEEELKRFDLQSILGAPCLLSVVHNEKGKAKVASVSKLPKGFECPPAVNAKMAFWLDEFDGEVFESLPKGIQEMIQKSHEYQERLNADRPKGPAQIAEMDDDIPFALNGNDIIREYRYGKGFQRACYARNGESLVRKLQACA